MTATARRSARRAPIFRIQMAATTHRRLLALLATVLLVSSIPVAVCAETDRPSADGAPQRSEKDATSTRTNSAEAPAPAAQRSATPTTVEDNEQTQVPERDAALDKRPFLEPSPGVLAEQAPSTFNLLARTTGSLALILGLLVGGTALFRRFGGPKALRASNDVPELAVLSSVPLGRERTLALVRFGSRTLLVGSTPHAITLLTESDEHDERAPVSVAELLDSDDFAAELERASVRPIDPNA